MRTIYRVADSSIFQIVDSIYVFNCCHDIDHNDGVDFWMVRFHYLTSMLDLKANINFSYTGKNVIKIGTNFIILVLKSTKQNNLPNGFG